MNNAELDVLENLDLEWVGGPGQVWEPSPYHVDNLHPDTSRKILEGIDQATRNVKDNPVGLVMQGAGGTGKTHMLGWTRGKIQEVGGYFFLVTVPSQENFWDAMLGFVRDGLARSAHDGRSQLSTLLNDLASRADLTSRVREAVTGERAPTPAELGAFVQGIRRIDPAVSLECQDTIRALLLFGSPQQGDQEMGHFYLSGIELTQEERARSGIRDPRGKVSSRLFTEISRVLALSGPTVLAVDQIDGLIESVERAKESSAQSELQVLHVANSLMDLYDRTHRTFTILSCIPSSWAHIRSNTIDTVAARFQQTETLRNIPDANAANAVLRRRFEPAYAIAGYDPPYPTWPVRPDALERATEFTVRELLRRVSDHVDGCLRDRDARVLEDLGSGPHEAGATISESRTPTEPAIASPVALPSDVGLQEPSVVQLESLDRRFEELASAANVEEPLDPTAEEQVLPGLLRAGLEAWMVERPEDGRVYGLEPVLGSRRPDLHAQLFELLDEETELKRTWCFRAITVSDQRAVLSRLRRAREMAGVGPTTRDRSLILIRNTSWPKTGEKTLQELGKVRQSGAIEIGLVADDIRTFSALRDLVAERDPMWTPWLRSRRPAHRTELLSRVLGTSGHPAEGIGEPLAEPSSRAGEVPNAQLPFDSERIGQQRVELSDAGASCDPSFSVGAESGDGCTVLVGRTGRGKPVELEVRSLLRHVLVVAGSGSGKTVLLRRLIEECALHGISSIVLDGEGDLARLGDPWPSPPDGWGAGDEDRARDYLVSVEVVVWTPGRTAGRPLSFRPLPEFPAYDGDSDRFREAVDAAVATLGPRLSIGENQKGKKEQAVLRQCLNYFGREDCGTELEDLQELMMELPAEVSRFSDGASVAAGLAERLETAKVNDEMFAGIGDPVDPALLLTPSDGKRARVSVISLSGMGQEKQQSFVNQLQTSLFSWVQKNPAARDRLRSLLVMDEAQRFIPAQGKVTSTDSTLTLAARARKYGLGLVFATQLPKGLRHEVASNASTHLVGRLGSNAAQNVAQDLARNRGGELPNLGALEPREFYVGVEGQSFRKLRTLMCLSHHDGPLAEHEIMRRARPAG